MPDNEKIKKTAAQDQSIKDWMSSYVGSPKYKERLSNFYKYPDYIKNQRAKIISGLTIKDDTKGDSGYDDNLNQIKINPNEIKGLGSTREEALVHEAGHSLNVNEKNKAAFLNTPERRFIIQRNKALIPELKESVLESSSNPDAASRLSNSVMHDVAPAENKSDIDAFRFLLKQRNIYDAGTQNITPEILEKAKKDPVLRRSFIFKRLKESFNDDSLMDIMNKVAKNKSKKQSNTA